MIDWNDNAKAAVKEFYRWANLKHRAGCSVDTDKFFSELDVTRPTQKTVADAVRVHNCKWPFSSGIELMGYAPKLDHYFAFGDGYSFMYGEYQVCTREEFEAYVKEQDSEKWTHTYSDYGVRKDCILIHGKPDIHGQVLVLNRYDEYVLTGTVELKPIKPKLTKAEAWDLCQDYDGPKSMKKYMFDLYETYDIT